MSRSLRAPALVAAALLAVLAADASLVVQRREGSAPSAAPVPSSSPSPAPGASSSPTPRPGLPADDLEGRLHEPDGFERLDDDESRLGTLDVAAFAKRFAASDAEAARVRTGLMAVGFESARGHAWVGDGRVYSCVVVRLVSDAGAERLLRSSRQEATRTFRSATVPGALTYVEDVEGFSVQHGLFQRDRFVYEVTLTTPEPERDHAVFDELLLAQRNRAESSDP